MIDPVTGERVNDQRPAGPFAARPPLPSPGSLEPAHEKRAPG
ncbi:hypothetical protein [Actinomadura napierensis]